MQHRAQRAGGHQRDGAAEPNHQAGKRDGERWSEHIGDLADDGKGDERRRCNHPSPDGVDPSAHLVGGPFGHVCLHGDHGPRVGQTKKKCKQIEHRNRRFEHGRNHDEWPEIAKEKHVRAPGTPFQPAGSKRADHGASAHRNGQQTIEEVGAVPKIERFLEVDDQGDRQHSEDQRPETFRDAHAAEDRSGPNRVKSLAHLVGRVARDHAEPTARTPVARWEHQAPDPGNGDGVADRLQDKRRTGPGNSYDRGTERRADDARDGAGDLHERERRHQCVWFHDRRQYGQAGWHGEGLPNPEQDGDDTELGRCVDEWHKRDGSSTKGIRDEHDAAAVEVVRQHSGKGRENRARQHLQDEDDAHERGRTGHVVDQQRQRHLSDGFSQSREEVPGPEILELGVPQNLSVGVRGHRVRSPGSRVQGSTLSRDGTRMCCSSPNTKALDLDCAGRWTLDTRLIPIPPGARSPQSVLAGFQAGKRIRQVRRVRRPTTSWRASRDALRSMRRSAIQR